MLCSILRRQTVLGARDGQSPTVFDKRFGDLRYRKHKVHRARHDRASRHAIIAGLVGVLRNDEPGFFLHGLQPKAAVVGIQLEARILNLAGTAYA
jgi:hypothetical protein